MVRSEWRIYRYYLAIPGIFLRKNFDRIDPHVRRIFRVQGRDKMQLIKVTSALSNDAMRDPAVANIVSILSNSPLQMA